MNIEALGFVRQIYNKENKQNIKKPYDLSDRSFVNSILDENPDTNGTVLSVEESKASDRWTNESLYTFDSSPKGYSVNGDALLKVKEQLKSKGIDADKRTPTHEITDEQIEWLNSKYDLQYLSECSISETEFGNFMLDLAYLNVFSFDEVENMYAGIFPPMSDKPQLISFYYHGDPETGAGAGYVDLNAEGTVVNEDLQREHITNYLKAEKPGLTDKEYREMTTEYAAQFQERVNIFEEIFNHFANLIGNNIENSAGGDFLKIEDASEKLKEDFSGKM